MRTAFSAFTLLSRAAALALSFACAATAHAGAGDIVISQVYGGGGNASATYTHDYVELFNRSSVNQTLDGLSIQYASATGAGNFGATATQITVLPNGVTLLPGQYYLVRQASTAAVGAALPTPYFIAPNPVAMAAGAGKVALVNKTTSLGCNGSAAQPCDAAQLALIYDLVGYGTGGSGASFYEGSAAAPTLSAVLADFRGSNGCTDSNSNSADFSAALPVPRTSASSLNPCGAPVNQPIAAMCSPLTVVQGAGGSVALSASDNDSIVNGVSITSAPVAGISLGTPSFPFSDGGTASVDLNAASSLATGSYSVQVTFTNNEAQSSACTLLVSVTGVTPIAQIQGPGAASPIVGQTVTTQGVVTKVIDNYGYFIQDEIGDGNDETSEGIFVYNPAIAPAPVVLGNKIRLTGTVVEFNTLTELTGPSGVTLVSSGHSINPVPIAFPEAVEGGLERYEGMLVQINATLTISQNYFQGRYGEVTLSAGGRMEKATNKFRPGTPEANALIDENARRRITLDDGSNEQNPNPIPYIIGADQTLRAGDLIDGLTGVLTYGAVSSSLNDYKLHPTAAPVITRNNPRPAPPAVGGRVKVMSANVLNYFTTFSNGNTASGQTGQGCTLGGSTAAANCRGADNLTEFNRQRNKILASLSAANADVVGLMEIQNNGNTAVQNLVDGLNASLGAGTYAVAPLPPVTGTDAIRVALIYKPASLALVGASLSDADPIHNRPPLAVGLAAANGKRFYVVVNHFKSKGCDGASGADLDQGDGQGCFNDRRVQQAGRLVSFIDGIKAGSGIDDVIIIGDLNAYSKEDPVVALTDAGYVDLIELFNASEYSYVFDGESGSLDHGLASSSLVPAVTGTAHWHINADEPSVIDYNTEFKTQDLYAPTAYRSSDHDPLLIGLTLLKAINGTAGRDVISGTPGDDVINAGEGADVITGGGGRDVFVYQSMRDGTDTITDFTPGDDRIDLTQLLASIGYNGSTAVAAGYVRVINVSGGCSVQIDADGAAGPGVFRPLVTLRGVSAAQIDTARDLGL